MKKTLDLVYIALFAVVLAVCSWISIPSAVPFTLQTFGVFCALLILGGKRGTMSVIIYILLGAIGLPVFAGFSGGLGILFGSTGGYIIGFIFTGLAYLLLTKSLGESLKIRIIALVFGLILCYAFGTLWFILIYTNTTGAIGVSTALGLCVVPFIIPDAIKMALAFYLSRILKKRIKLDF